MGCGAFSNLFTSPLTVFWSLARKTEKNKNRKIMQNNAKSFLVQFQQKKQLKYEKNNLRKTIKVNCWKFSLPFKFTLKNFCFDFSS
jgi:hypothetical protein